jgi:hypothetical protein
MEQEKKEVDATLDSFADSGVEIPQSHWVIQENIWFIGSMAKKVRKGEWTINDVRDFLESRGYKRETVNRFVRAVSLQLREVSDLTDKDSPPCKKPERSEGAMSREEAEKIRDPEARRFAKEYLDETEAYSGEADRPVKKAKRRASTASRSSASMTSHDKH